jgi:hypothetical protein
MCIYPIEIASVCARISTVQATDTISQVAAAFDLSFAATGTLTKSISLANGQLFRSRLHGREQIQHIEDTR